MVLRFSGGVRPAVPVFSVPLEDITSVFLYDRLLILLSRPCGILRRYESETVNSGGRYVDGQSTHTHRLPHNELCEIPEIKVGKIGVTVPLLLDLLL